MTATTDTWRCWLADAVRLRLDLIRNGEYDDADLLAFVARHHGNPDPQVLADALAAAEVAAHVASPAWDVTEHLGPLPHGADRERERALVLAQVEADVAWACGRLAGRP